MGSRKGNVILFSQLRERLTTKITADFLEDYRGTWSNEEIDQAARRIAVATIKYGMTNHDNQKPIVFDLDEWTAKSGMTGPYMMYAYARTRSILRKAKGYDEALADWSLLAHEHEQTLLTALAKFPEVAERACHDYRPQWLCIYLYDLARDFSRMYENCPVLQAETPALRATRLMLVDAAGRAIRKGLALLGIETLERL
jgi:arginyl-tRNA synthetase